MYIVYHGTCKLYYELHVYCMYMYMYMYTHVHYTCTIYVHCRRVVMEEVCPHLPYQRS